MACVTKAQFTELRAIVAALKTNLTNWITSKRQDEVLCQIGENVTYPGVSILTLGSFNISETDIDLVNGDVTAMESALTLIQQIEANHA